MHDRMAQHCAIAGRGCDYLCDGARHARENRDETRRIKDQSSDQSSDSDSDEQEATQAGLRLELFEGEGCEQRRILPKPP